MSYLYEPFLSPILSIFCIFAPPFHSFFLFLGPSLQDLNSDMVNSPGGTRRRRSRIPSEEDDQLINFLVTGQENIKEKNLSVGNLVAESQQNYGSLDRGLMRRSRGRRRPEMLNIDSDSRDRSAPNPSNLSVAEKPPKSQPKVQEPEPKSDKIKNRIESWLKDAEEDAEKAEMYLDKKREIKHTNGKKSTDIVPPTDVLKAMQVVEDASESREKANPRKKTPPGTEIFDNFENFFPLFVQFFVQISFANLSKKGELSRWSKF